VTPCQKVIGSKSRLLQNCSELLHRKGVHVNALALKCHSVFLLVVRKEAEEEKLCMDHGLLHDSLYFL